MLVFWLVGSEASLLLLLTVLRTNGVIDSTAFWTLLILGSLAIPPAIDYVIRALEEPASVRRKVGKTGVRQWSSLGTIESIETAWRPFSRAMSVLAVTFILLSTGYLVWLGLVATFLPERLSQWPSHDGLIVLSHWVGTITLLLLLMANVVLWEKNRAKHRRLLRLQRALADASEAFEVVLSRPGPHVQHEPF